MATTKKTPPLGYNSILNQYSMAPDPMKRLMESRYPELLGSKTVAPTASAATAPATPGTQVYNPISDKMISAPIPVTPTYVDKIAAPEAPKMRQITDNETVAGQLNKLLSQDSPYMQNAKTKALEQANARGLINSSMAVGAAQRSAIDAALPIAQSDASTYAASGLSAQNAGQQLSQTKYEGGVNSALNKEKFGYDATLNTQNISANGALQSQKDAAALTQLQSQLGSQQSIAAANNAAAIQQAQLNADAAMARQKAAAESDLALQNAKYASEAGLLASKSAAELELQTKLQEMKNQGEIDLQTALKDQGLGIDYAKLEAAEKETITNVIQQYQQQIANIDRTPDEQMDSTSKLTAIAKQKAVLQTALSLYDYEINWDTMATNKIGSTPTGGTGTGSGTGTETGGTDTGTGGTGSTGTGTGTGGAGTGTGSTGLIGTGGSDMPKLEIGGKIANNAITGTFNNSTLPPAGEVYKVNDTQYVNSAGEVRDAFSGLVQQYLDIPYNGNFNGSTLPPAGQLYRVNSTYHVDSEGTVFGRDGGPVGWIDPRTGTMVSAASVQDYSDYPDSYRKYLPQLPEVYG